MPFRSATFATGTNNSITIDLPAGVQDGDWLAYIVDDEYAEGIDWTFTPADTEVTTVDGGEARAGGSAVAFRLASSEPSSRTFTRGAGGTDPMKGACVAISGRDSATPTLIQVTNDAGHGNGTVSTPLGGVTAIEGDDVVILTHVSAGNHAGSWVFTPPTNYTTRATANTTGNVFFGGAVAIATRDNVSAGATGTLTGSWGLAATAGESAGVVVAFAASGSSGEEITGTGALTGPVSTSSGAGVVGRSGAGSLSAAAVTTAGTALRGVRDLPGAIELFGPKATLSGEGTVTTQDTEHEGEGALVIAPMTLAGSGIRRISGTGALSIAIVEVSGFSGPKEVLGEGALVCGLPQVFASSVRGISGDGALTAPAARLFGRGLDTSGGEDMARLCARKPSKRSTRRYAHGRRGLWPRT